MLATPAVSVTKPSFMSLIFQSFSSPFQSIPLDFSLIMEQLKTKTNPLKRVSYNRKIPESLFFFFFLLEYRHLTMLWGFQVNSKGTHPYIYLYAFLTLTSTYIFHSLLLVSFGTVLIPVLDIYTWMPYLLFKLNLPQIKYITFLPQSALPCQISQLPWCIIV